MNVVQKLTGAVLPFGELVFTRFNLVPTLVMLFAMPFVLAWLRPRDEDAVPLDTAKHPDEPVRKRPEGRLSFAQKIEYSWLGSAFIGAAGIGLIVLTQFQHIAFSGVNAVIFVMFIAGVILHGYPLAYADAIKNAAKQTGSMMLQYPLYGGIMGMMDSTGLPDVISHFFIAISNAHMLPFWSYVCSLIVTFFIPSGGGHWAVQGPFVVPAAVALRLGARDDDGHRDGRASLEHTAAVLGRAGRRDGGRRRATRARLHGDDLRAQPLRVWCGPADFRLKETTR